ncbi:Hpt domain-containing protein [Aquabacterium sp.]|uniref:Hpt domain-containing protein n=1 Tax=Aquabacterium sp. TaxID=1872578 RepID=UPI002E357DEF|nr:Hpt domain-containing protein [Aquabacterium sp.]HEX5310429.1 Hpt domain-containing protein [Aquabacterium sp.]
MQGSPATSTSSGTPGHEASGGGGGSSNPMRKIIIMVGVAILVFLAVTTFSVQKSFQSSDQLTAIKDLYFPVLQKIEANMVRLDKMEELFMRSVMLGDNDPLDEEQDFYQQADKAFEEMATIYPQQAKEIARLRADLKQYQEIANRTALALNNKDTNIDAKKMNQLLASLRESIKVFREASYGNFVKTLADSQGTVKLNLYMGIALGLMNLCFMGVLVFFIRNNVRMMAVIAEQNATLELRVAERTAQLRQKTNDIQAMLENMPQGVLTVLPGGVIHPEYSAYMENIFETTEIAGKNMMDLVFSNTTLGSDALSTVEVAVGSVIGEDAMNYEFNSHLLATEFDKTMPNGVVKSLELSWSPITDDNDVVEKLMLCVRDVTELKRLASEAGAQKRELEIIGEILAVSQEKFQEFIDSAKKFVAENREIIKNAAGKDQDAVGLLFRNMHTIKGNARTYGLLNMTNTVHETEQVYDDLRKDPEKAWEPEAMLAQLDQVDALLDEYGKINDVKLGRKGPGRRGSVEKFLMVEKDHVARALNLIKSAKAADAEAMKAALHEVDQTLSLIGTEKIDHVLAGIIESMPSLAKELGKEPPKISIEDHGIVVRTQIVGLLKNVFTHVFRNSMDHGLETAEVREAAGKSAAGHIRLKLSTEGGRLVFRLGDDGRGLAVGKIRQKAIDNGLIQAGDAVPPEQVAQLIFASGFSTAEKVTEVSGRGVGMDAVKGFLQREGGDVAIQFTDDNAAAEMRPFELVISLPEKFAAHLSA